MSLQDAVCCPFSGPLQFKAGGGCRHGLGLGLWAGDAISEGAHPRVAAGEEESGSGLDDMFVSPTDRLSFWACRKFRNRQLPEECIFLSISRPRRLAAR